MKTVFLINSLAPMALFFSVGLNLFEDKALFKRVVILYTALFSILVTVHILLLFFNSNFRGFTSLQ